MKTPGPPGWAEKFLTWFCRPELLEEILGDLYELHDIRSSDGNERVANRRFVWDVLRSFRLSVIKEIHPYLFSAMFKNHLKVATRNISRHKLYSAIKVAGFALGIASCVLLLLYIRHENSFDKHVPDADRIFKVCVDYNVGGAQFLGSATPSPMAAAMAADLPQVEAAGRIQPFFGFAGSNQFRKVEETTNSFEENFVYADQEWLNIFQLEFETGAPERALLEPYTMILSHEVAEKHFGQADPVGEMVILNEDVENPVRITGVLAPQPETSHFEFDYIVSMGGLQDATNPSWVGNNYMTYIKLKEGVDPAQMPEPLMAFALDHLAADYMEVMALDIRPGNESGDSFEIFLQNIQDIHLKSGEIAPQLKPVGNIQYIWLFTAIAIAVLLIAIINFVNLSTARLANRAREVGIRKTLGSFKRQLIYQYLTESTLLTLIAVVLGLVIAELCLPSLSSITEKSLSMPWGEFWFWGVIATGTAIIGGLSGLYPAFVLSGFSPIATLKGSLSTGTKNKTLRSGLVVFQFATSIALIICTILVYRQMTFIQQSDVGFDREQVLIMHDTDMLNDRIGEFRNTLTSLPEVQSASVSRFLPVEGFDYNDTNFWPEGKFNQEDQITAIQQWFVDEHYLETLGMELVAGRNFSSDRGTESQNVLVNETFARQLAVEEPLGARITTFGDQTFNIVGIVKDFHWETLRKEVRGVVMILGESNGAISVKASGADMEALIAKAGTIWGEFAPNQTFRYTFLDERFARMYQSEQQIGTLFGAFSVLAILIACMGMFALAAYLAEQRLKEISIRKVLGASSNGLFFLLIRNFMWLIGIAFIIGVPVGWYLMDEWLAKFAYSPGIGVGVFLIAGGIMVTIALLTVSYQAIRVATANPAETLAAEG